MRRLLSLSLVLASISSFAHNSEETDALEQQLKSYKYVCSSLCQLVKTGWVTSPRYTMVWSHDVDLDIAYEKLSAACITARIEGGYKHAELYGFSVFRAHSTTHNCQRT